MNIAFISLWKITNVQEPGIYNDLLRTFRDKGHSVYAVTPKERRDKGGTELQSEHGIINLQVKVGNIIKTNIIEKGISTVLLEKQYKNAIKKYFTDVKFDLVLFATPPITLLNVIKYLKKKDNAETYLLLKDIFPQNAIDLNLFSKKSVIYKFFRKKEKELYRVADYIGTMSPANKEYLLKHNPEIESSKVEICPNTITPIDIKITESDKIKIRKKYYIPLDKTIYIYGGSIGKPQGVEYIIKCIKQNERNHGTFILIIGSGTEYEKLEKYFNQEKPINAKLMNALPKKEYETLAHSADVGLIFLDYRFTIPNFPSRFLSYLQASMPVIAATDVNTDIGEIIETNNLGYWNISNDVNEFNNNLLKLNDKTKIEQQGLNAHRYLKENYTSEHAYQIIMNRMKRG